MIQSRMTSRTVVSLLGLLVLLIGVTPLLFMACSNGSFTGPTAPEETTGEAVLSATAQGNPRNNEFVCDDYDLKDPVEREKYTFNSQSGQAISEICMKRGQDQFTATCNPGATSNDGCLEVTWNADCSTVMLERLRTGRDCQGMSHAAVNFGDPPPSPTATPPPI